MLEGIIMKNPIDEYIPITKPTLPDYDELAPDISEIISNGMITNHKYVQIFEENVAEYLGVEHAVAVSSCTAGMMLVIKSMGLKGEVILPSFTFHATAHAIVWNGLKLKFVDIDPETLTIDPEKVEENITKETSAVCGVHIFGNSCDINALQDISDDHNIKLYFDAAHGFGSKYQNKNIGTFGDAEIFSLSPTKLVVAGEGGIVATNDQKLKDQLVIGRNYGDDGSYNCKFAGFNARMAEFNAILGASTLRNIEQNVNRRNELVSKYKSHLNNMPGLSFQTITPNSRSTYKDFSIYIDSGAFGMNRDDLEQKLSLVDIGAKKYFYPPVHKQDAYSTYAQCDAELPITNNISENVLSLPLWSDMPESIVEHVCNAIAKIRADGL